MYKALFFLMILGLLSCKEEKASISSTEKTVTVKEPLQMYQLSEMASFMEEMYAEHQVLKEQILNGETPDSLSYNLLNLHTATMTDSSDYDDSDDADDDNSYDTDISTDSTDSELQQSEQAENSESDEMTAADDQAEDDSAAAPEESATEHKEDAKVSMFGS